MGYYEACRTPISDCSSGLMTERRNCAKKIAGAPSTFPRTAGSGSMRAISTAAFSMKTEAAFGRTAPFLCLGPICSASYLPAGSTPLARSKKWGRMA